MLIYQDAWVLELLFHLGSVFFPEHLHRLKIGGTGLMMRCIRNLLWPGLYGLLTHKGRIAQRVAHLAVEVVQCSKSIKRWHQWHWLPCIICLCLHRGGLLLGSTSGFFEILQYFSFHEEFLGPPLVKQTSLRQLLADVIGSCCWFCLCCCILRSSH